MGAIAHAGLGREAACNLIGWSLEKHMRQDLVAQALLMAARQRTTAGVMHHSDVRDPDLYTSLASGKRCEAIGIRQSMGSVGDCYDNAMAESLFASMEC